MIKISRFSKLVWKVSCVINFLFVGDKQFQMSVFHDEVEIEDFEYDEEDETYYYPCPCGDRFQISKVKKCYIFLKLVIKMISMSSL